MMPFSSLSLRRLTYSLGIGVTEAERSIPQPVSVSIEMRFATLPKACKSRTLEESVDYASIARVVAGVAEDVTYELIETLGHDIFQAVKKCLPEGVLVGVTIDKERAPIPELRDGAVFFIADWEP